MKNSKDRKHFFFFFNFPWHIIFQCFDQFGCQACCEVEEASKSNLTHRVQNRNVLGSLVTRYFFILEAQFLFDSKITRGQLISLSILLRLCEGSLQCL